MPTYKKFDKVNKQLDFHLKNEIWADKYESFTRSPSHGIKQILTWWEKSQSTLQNTISCVNYTDLKYTARNQALLSYDDYQITRFKLIPSPENHYQVLDHHHNILVYCFRLPPPLITTLITSSSLLPQPVSTSTICGYYTHNHYTLWADYSKRYYIVGNTTMISRTDRISWTQTSLYSLIAQIIFG